MKDVARVLLYRGPHCTEKNLTTVTPKGGGPKWGLGSLYCDCHCTKQRGLTRVIIKCIHRLSFDLICNADVQSR